MINSSGKYLIVFESLIRSRYRYFIQFLKRVNDPIVENVQIEESWAS